jgi:hypothetical protein
MPDEVLTIKEVAALLELAETAYAIAQAGKIPAFKNRPVDRRAAARWDGRRDGDA